MKRPELAVSRESGAAKVSKNSTALLIDAGCGVVVSKHVYCKEHGVSIHPYVAQRVVICHLLIRRAPQAGDIILFNVDSF